MENPKSIKNGIIIDEKVYELVDDKDEYNCIKCDLRSRCKACFTCALLCEIFSSEGNKIFKLVK